MDAANFTDEEEVDNQILNYNKQKIKIWIEEEEKKDTSENTETSGTRTRKDDEHNDDGFADDDLEDADGEITSQQHQHDIFKTSNHINSGESEIRIKDVNTLSTTTTTTTTTTPSGEKCQNYNNVHEENYTPSFKRIKTTTWNFPRENQQVVVEQQQQSIEDAGNAEADDDEVPSTTWQSPSEESISTHHQHHHHQEQNIIIESSPKELHHVDTEESMLVGNPAIKYPVKYSDGRERKTYKCWYCPTIQYDLKGYEVHKEKHFKENIFKCNKCTFSCESVRLLNIHFTCHTSKYFHTSIRYSTIKRRHNVGGTIFRRRQRPSSAFSSKSSRSNIKYEAQIKPSTEIPEPTRGVAQPPRKPFKCTDPKCPYVTLYANHAENHRKRHCGTSSGPYQCPLCSYRAGKLGSMEIHVSTHYDDSSENETAMNNTGVNKSNDNNNISAQSYGESSTPSTPISHQCKLCPASFLQVDKLSQHMVRHKDKTSRFKCRFCSYAVQIRKYLHRHELLHGDQTQKQFNYQNQNFQVSSTSNASSRGGGGGSATNKGSLNGNNGIFKCKAPNCPHTFVRIIDRINHMQCHGVKAQYICNICDYGVTSIVTLRRHQLKHRNQVNHTEHNIVKRRIRSSTMTTNRNKPPQSYHHQYRSVRPSGYRSCVLRRALISKYNKPQYYHAVENGMVTEEEMIQIRNGNPKFKYEDHRVTSGGNTVATLFRCLLCPMSFSAFLHWKRHQLCNHSSNKAGNERFKYKCRHCPFQTVDKSTLTRHYNQQHQHQGQEQTKRRRISTEMKNNYVTKMIKGENVSSDNSDNEKPPVLVPMVNNWNQRTGNASPQLSSPSPCYNNNTNGQLGGSDSTVEVEINAQAKKAKLQPPKVTKEVEAFRNFSQPMEYLVTQIKIHNFLVLEDKEIEGLSTNLCGIRGSRNAGKTTTILACLIGLGYDILLELPEYSTICGVDISNVLRYGQTTGYIEIGLNLNLCEELRTKYGQKLKIKRNFQDGVKLIDSSIEISYGNIVGEKISIDKFKTLMNALIPNFLHRFVVLNSENLEYMADNFKDCDEILWKLAERRKTELLLKETQQSLQAEDFKQDLESRKERITYLKDSLKKDYRGIPKLRQLQTAHAVELQKSLELYKEVDNVYQRLIQEQPTSNGQVSQHVVELVVKMRIPFKKFLQSQNYVGDIIVREDGQELAIWMKDAQRAAHEPNRTITMEEAKHMWKTLTLGRRKLAIIGFYVAIWEVMDCCPVMVSDAYSTSDLEFKFPSGGLTVLLTVILGHEQSQRQFFLSLPDVLPKVE